MIDRACFKGAAVVPVDDGGEVVVGLWIAERTCQRQGIAAVDGLVRAGVELRYDGVGAVGAIFDVEEEAVAIDLRACDGGELAEEGGRIWNNGERVDDAGYKSI